MNCVGEERVGGALLKSVEERRWVAPLNASSMHDRHAGSTSTGRFSTLSTSETVAMTEMVRMSRIRRGDPHGFVRRYGAAPNSMGSCL